MSNPESPELLLQYRLGERLGNAVWKAEDTRTGKQVAVKILSRQLPRDPAKRDALVRDVRLGAALYHSSIVNIVEVAPAGDALILVMDFVDGRPVSSLVRGTPVDRETFFRVAYQIGDALKLLHAKNVIHGSVGGDAVLLLPRGQAKLCGFNLATFLQKREGMPSAFQQRGSEERAVAYMAPEQITNQPTTVQTDIFSLGLVLYEMATGRPAYQGPSAAEIARKIVGEQPPNPKSLNANIDNAMLTVLGKCLYKDPFRRYKDARAFVDEVMHADPEAAKFAAEIARLGVAPSAQGEAKSRNSILFLADIEGYERLETTDPGVASKAAARLQQIVGEAVYLFEGEVVDPFGPRVVAELPSVESALEAARKAEFDVSPDQQEGEHVPIRLLLHAGDVTTKEGLVVGEAVTKGLEVLDALPPSRLYISEEFARRGRGSVRLHDAGARAGVKLYEIAAAEPKAETKTEIHTAELEAAAAAEEEAARQAAFAAAKKRRLAFAAIAAAFFAVVAGTSVVLLRKPRTQTAVASAPKPLPPPSAATPAVPT